MIPGYLFFLVFALDSGKFSLSLLFGFVPVLFVFGRNRGLFPIFFDLDEREAPRSISFSGLSITESNRAFFFVRASFAFFSSRDEKKAAPRDQILEEGERLTWREISCLAPKTEKHSRREVFRKNVFEKKKYRRYAFALRGF